MAKKERNRGVAILETLSGITLTVISFTVAVQTEGLLDDVAKFGVATGIAVAFHGALGTSPRQRP